jgi:hypothetical protein
MEARLKVIPKWTIEKIDGGIVINGIPYKDYIKEVEDKRIRTEIDLEVKCQIKEKRAAISYCKPKHNSLIKNGPAGKCIIFPVERIRKEYPNMSVTEKTNEEKIVEVIIEQGPVTGGDISRHLGIGLSSTRSAISRITKSVSDLIDKIRVGKSVTYLGNKHSGLGEELTAKFVYEKYKERSKKKGIKKGTKKEVKIPLSSTPDLSTLMGIPKELKVTVEFIGQINVVFGFKKSD